MKHNFQYHHSRVTSMSFSPGLIFASASPWHASLVGPSNGCRGKPSPSTNSNLKYVPTSCLCSADSTKIVSGSLDCSLFVWDLPKGTDARIELKNTHIGGVSSVAPPQPAAFLFWFSANSCGNSLFETLIIDHSYCRCSSSVITHSSPPELTAASDAGSCEVVDQYSLSATNADLKQPTHP